MYRTGWPTVENVAEDADNDFFSRVLHNENHVLHPLLPERNDMVMAYELRRRRHERGLFLHQTTPNAVSYTNNYIGLSTNFSTRQLLYVV